MLHFRAAQIKVNGRNHALEPRKSNSQDTYYVDFQSDIDPDGLGRTTLYIHPKTDLVLQSVTCTWEVTDPALAEGWMLAQGFQSWSETRLLPVQSGQIRRLRWFARPHMGLYGDEHIKGITRGRGHLHAWSWTHLQRSPDDTSVLLAGSANESTGFTLWTYDARHRLLTATKDLRDGGLHLSHSFQALDVWFAHGSAHKVLDHYYVEILPTLRPRIHASEGLGWTSWYRHYTQITEDKIRHDLKGIQDSGLPFRYFQLDDGWQTHVGDWLQVKPDFPGGLAALSRDIRAHGLQPGIWMAPFVVSRQAELYRKHPEWLLRDAQNKPIRVGWNPMWGGWYYALDFYNPQVRDYLSGVFHVATEKWGFELFKLDFLFAVCLAPPAGKTRGQVMHEAMQFLRDQVGQKALLACGAPLGTSVGTTDIMRIGGDIHLKWKHGLLTWLRHRERVDTLASLRSTLSRWALNGRAWANDPDVFILRTDGQHLTLIQQHTVLTINALLGTLLFTSDDVGAYTEEQNSELRDALHWRGAHIESVVEMGSPDVFRIQFQRHENHYYAYCNLSARTVWIQDGLQLPPYDSIILKNVS
jgi:alpha-galactosidase